MYCLKILVCEKLIFREENFANLSSALDFCDNTF